LQKKDFFRKPTIDLDITLLQVQIKTNMYQRASDINMLLVGNKAQNKPQTNSFEKRISEFVHLTN